MPTHTTTTRTGPTAHDIARGIDDIHARIDAADRTARVCSDTQNQILAELRAHNRRFKRWQSMAIVAVAMGILLAIFLLFLIDVLIGSLNAAGAYHLPGYP